MQNDAKWNKGLGYEKNKIGKSLSLFDWFKDGILSKYDMGKEINRRIKNYKQLI